MAVKRKQKLSRKEQIVNAARKLVIKYGSENVTVRKIADEVGFSEAAIYRHFKCKKDILYGLIESIEDNLLTDIGSRNQPEYGRLENVLFNHLSAVEMRKGISFQVIAEIVSMGDKKLNNRIHMAIERYIEKLREILREEIQKGELREDIDIDSAAIVLFSVVQGLSNIWTLSNYSFNPRDKFEPILRLIRRGLT
ncbi:MAG: TetR/AcrR family transcriptional regulator [Dehalococcoidia bacterium]|nr:TetR/AcrR family transcriptional regulator [Dehalococcoidia bacterium]